MRFGLPLADFAAGFTASVAMSAAPGVSGAGRLVGALTVVQSLFTLGISRGQQKTPDSSSAARGLRVGAGLLQMLKGKSGTNAPNYYEHPGLSGGIHSARR
ncbi:hypothetical protein MINTM008_40110 [Mycobacterium intracellulare]|uniref:Uncharacterized protein n=2 Tax=Mycobacterium avium complex (MAC) TaxID=120793 RepID=A0A7R7MWT1_MYCIT|nr:hypothetical protein MPRI_04070 [Mycobacterium paraintracellulare]BCO48066.1 hypothetical protein MINTM002_37400 [Mycobacterium intracellulare]BCP38407.1 hypothetical protein MINTMi198_37770 [Mycobacterium intracellulare M.i.198]BCO42811.1 hypothetical protein MINTM001_39500 [Mycobacterium paraintracellulare]BCO58589.1 hypothetical protein MINTM005_38330 [Mycobacterium intracellulare]